MRRTQLLLAEDQHGFLVGEARRQGSSVSAVVRLLISERMPRGGKGDPLEELIGMVGRGDAAERYDRIDEKDHDAIIYGLAPRLSSSRRVTGSG